jgi:hypothetical protein
MRGGTIMLADIMTTWSRWEILMPVGLGLLSTLLWRVPILKLLFYPFQLFNTFIHELCHGFVALLTGGGFRFMLIHQNTDGVANIRGGKLGIVATAGYLGSVVVSGLFIQLPTALTPAPLILIWMGITLMVMCVFFVRNLFGLISGIALSVALVGAGRILDDYAARLVLVVFAIEMPLVAMHSLWILVRISLQPVRPDRFSDAHQLHKITGIPPVIWAVLWYLVGLGIILVAVTIAYH